MRRLFKYTSKKMLESGGSSDVESGTGSSKRLLTRNSTKKNHAVVEGSITHRLHMAVWPSQDKELVNSMLEQHPDELHKQMGVHQDTLLHR